MHQLLPALHHGDAVGNEALAWRGLLRAAGWRSDIFAGRVDPRLLAEARPLREWSEEGAILFHFGPDSPAGRLAAAARGPLVLRYHNLTPPESLADFAPALARTAAAGRQELRALARRAALGLCPSRFNQAELEALGCARTALVPLAVDLDLAARPRSPVVEKLFGDGRTNVLTVGRLAPNKKVEDVIAAFALYQRVFDRGARLLLVGGSGGFESYERALHARARELGAQRVVFAGHVEDDELAACYACADVLVTLSEHEGFCAPLLEAMAFDVPVLAYDAGAVRETLGGAGVLLLDKRLEEAAALLDALVRDAGLRRRVLAGQRQALARRRAEDPGRRLLDHLTALSDTPGGART